MTAGRRYTVGEAGPETFVPETSGFIIPNPSTVVNNYNTSKTVNPTVNATIGNQMDLAGVADALVQAVVEALQ